jgi:hypothetical protein
MKNSTIIISDFYKIQKEFCYINSINLYCNLSKYEDLNYGLDIVLYNNDFENNSHKLLIKFYGVKNIEFGNLNMLVNSFINIIDISKDQLEKINYKVVEDENNLFSFYCKSFEFVVI